MKMFTVFGKKISTTNVLERYNYFRNLIEKIFLTCKSINFKSKKSMITICSISCLFVITILFYGGGDSDESSVSQLNNKYVQLVRNSAFNIDNSITIGNAFDKYSYIKNPTWKFYENDRGQKIVEFSGDLKYEYIFVKNAKLVKFLESYNLERLKLMFQFFISTSGENFELKKCGYKYDNKYSYFNNNEIVQAVNCIYNNDSSLVTNARLFYNKDLSSLSAFNSYFYSNNVKSLARLITLFVFKNNLIEMNKLVACIDFREEYEEYMNKEPKKNEYYYKENELDYIKKESEKPDFNINIIYNYTYYVKYREVKHLLSILSIYDYEYSDKNILTLNTKLTIYNALVPTYYHGVQNELYPINNTDKFYGDTYFIDPKNNYFYKLENPLLSHMTKVADIAKEITLKFIYSPEAFNFKFNSLSSSILLHINMYSPILYKTNEYITEKDTLKCDIILDDNKIYANIKGGDIPQISYNKDISSIFNKLIHKLMHSKIK